MQIRLQSYFPVDYEMHKIVLADNHHGLSGYILFSLHMQFNVIFQFSLKKDDKFIGSVNFVSIL